MRIVMRDELPKDYSEMMESESHHEHRIIEDEYGTLRWEEDDFIIRFIDECSLNDIVMGFHSKGNGKNCEEYRELYRKMGYSLNGYWEMFYWEMNNEGVADYRLKSYTKAHLKEEQDYGT